MALAKQPRVLGMSGLAAPGSEAVVRGALAPAVLLPAPAAWLGRVSAGAGRMVAVHVEVDSGMTRQGARPGAELRTVAQAIAAAKGLRLDGLMTHIASAEVAGSEQTAAQMR